MQSGLTPASRRVTKRQEAAFAGKQSLLRVKRWAQDKRQGLRRHPRGVLPSSAAVVAESRTPLWMEIELSERRMQLGKVQNLRVALRALDGTVVPAGEIFSFWKQIGRASRRRGFVPGRELRGGCLIPTVGGGLCQLSNALYDLAIETGCEIVERHGHSATVPGAASKSRRDATVAWNYIDLRFRPKNALLIRARMDANSLIVQFYGTSMVSKNGTLLPKNSLRVLNRMGSCVSCDESDCSRHRPDLGVAPGEPKAFVLNGTSPEFLEHMRGHSTAQDSLFVPIDGKRFRQSRYAWPLGSSGDVFTATLQVFGKAFLSRIRRKQTPAEMRAAQFAADESIAIALGNRLRPEHTHVVVAQSFLPFLWREGFLGGRTFDVLMERLPLGELQKRLDEAYRDFPEQKLLADFRVDARLVNLEAAALNAARRIVTPHSGIAGLFSEKAELLNWKSAESLDKRASSGTAIVFPGPTAARKGAYAVREVARRLNIPVYVLGNELEGDDFWKGVEIFRCSPRDEDWIANARVVLQPSISEDRPYVLLRALSAGIPIVTCDMHGLPPHPLIKVVSFGDVDAIVRGLDANKL